MKVSVIVPVYNCGPYVERCIRSILAQTYGDLEIICVNDGSTDDSGNILNALAGEDARICVIHQENAGVSAARNAGIERATGEFITFVDSDDAVEADMYETLLPYFDDEIVDIVHCGYKRIHLDGSVKDVSGTGKLVRQHNCEAAECLLSGKLFVGSLCNKIYRTHLFRNFQMDTSLAINEDILANAEVFCRAHDLVYLDVGKYWMYERKGSVTSDTRQYKLLTDCATAAEKMCAIYRGTSAETAAEERVLTARINLYRWYVLHALANSRSERNALDKTIADIWKKRKNRFLKQRLNYMLLRHVPGLYKLAYTVYDRIRVPNWDVK